jgi:hypothetical protein
MNIRERLQIRALVNLIVSVLERLVNLIIKLGDINNKKITPINPSPVAPDKKRPIKKVIDTIDKVIPWPWRKSNE